ncbi:unnamed protein product, partial [Polarella glacialis]
MGGSLGCEHEKCQAHGWTTARCEIDEGIYCPASDVVRFANAVAAEDAANLANGCSIVPSLRERSNLIQSLEYDAEKAFEVEAAVLDADAQAHQLHMEAWLMTQVAHHHMVLPEGMCSKEEDDIGGSTPGSETTTTSQLCASADGVTFADATSSSASSSAEVECSRVVEQADPVIDISA